MLVFWRDGSIINSNVIDEDSTYSLEISVLFYEFQTVSTQIGYLVFRHVSDLSRHKLLVLQLSESVDPVHLLPMKMVCIAFE